VRKADDSDYLTTEAVGNAVETRRRQTDVGSVPRSLLNDTVYLRRRMVLVEQRVVEARSKLSSSVWSRREANFSVFMFCLPFSLV